MRVCVCVCGVCVCVWGGGVRACVCVCVGGVCVWGGGVRVCVVCVGGVCVCVCVLLKVLHLVYASRVQTTVWLSVFGMFNVHTDTDACDFTRGPYGHRKTVCTAS